MYFTDVSISTLNVRILTGFCDNPAKGSTFTIFADFPGKNESGISTPEKKLTKTDLEKLSPHAAVV